MSLLATVPATFNTTSHEKQLIAFDYTLDLAESEIIVSATSTLTEIRSGVAYAAGLYGLPDISDDGKQVAQWVYSLEARERYALRLEVVTSTGRELEPELRLIVDY